MVVDETYNSAAPLDQEDQVPGYHGNTSQVIPLITADGDSVSSNDLPKSVLDYYLSIEKVLEKEEFDNESERLLLEEKLLDQLKSDGLMKLLYHWDGSRVVERLLVNCSAGTLLQLGALLLPHTLLIACHNFASHVLELFLMKLVTFVYTQESPALLETAEQVFRKLCLNVAELVSNVHGSYSLRLALQVLIGTRVEDEAKKRKRWEIGKDSFYQVAVHGRTIHPALKRVLHKFTKRLLKEDIAALIRSQHGAPLLGVLLHLLQTTDNKSLEKLKTVILEELVETDSTQTVRKEETDSTQTVRNEETEDSGVEKCGPLPALLLHKTGSYVIQALIKVSTKQELEELYNSHYKTQLVALSLHPVGNYTVQTLLDHCPTRDIAEHLCTVLLPLVEDLLAESITGIVISVIKCCHHYALTSHNIRKVLQDAFHVPNEQVDLLFRCIMSLTTHDMLCTKMESYKQPTQSGKPRRDRFEATLTGSLLLQGLFKLGEIQDLEEGICGLSEDHVTYLSTNQQSSHAIQAYLTSLTIPATSKHRYIRSAVGVVDKLVITPCGSRVVEAMWGAADSQLKASIAQVLLDKESQIRDNSYGAIVWRNCNIKAFKLGAKAWEDAENKRRRKVEDFENIINNGQKTSQKSESGSLTAQEDSLSLPKKRKTKSSEANSEKSKSIKKKKSKKTEEGKG